MLLRVFLQKAEIQVENRNKGPFENFGGVGDGMVYDNLLLMSMAVAYSRDQCWILVLTPFVTLMMWLINDCLGYLPSINN